MKTKLTLLLLIFTLFVKAQITPTLLNNNIANYDTFPHAIAYYNGEIYFPDFDNGKIVKTSATISNAPVITVLSNLQYPTGIKVIGNNLYFLQVFTNTTLSVNSGKLSKIDLTQSIPTIVDIITNLSAPLLIDGNSSALIITETFWNFPTNNLDDAQFQSTSISKINFGPNQTKTIIFQNRPFVDDMKLGDTQLYWSEYISSSDVGRIVKCNPFAVTPTILLYYNFGTTDSVVKLAIDNDILYMSLYNAQNVIKYAKLTDSTVNIQTHSTPVIYNSSNIIIGGMITFNNNLYFSATGQNTSAKSLLYKLNISTLDTQEAISGKSIVFYPNPTKSTLNFSEELSEIKVIDMSGKMVSSTTEKTNTINLEKLPKGNYLMNAKDKTGQFISQKFIKD